MMYVYDYQRNVPYLIDSGSSMRDREKRNDLVRAGLQHTCRSFFGSILGFEKKDTQCRYPFTRYINCLLRHRPRLNCPPPLFLSSPQTWPEETPSTFLIFMISCFVGKHCQGLDPTEAHYGAVSNASFGILGKQVIIGTSLIRSPLQDLSTLVG